MTRILIAAACAMLLLTACGKKGDPKTPAETAAAQQKAEQKKKTQ